MSSKNIKQCTICEQWFRRNNGGFMKHIQTCQQQVSLQSLTDKKHPRSSNSMLSMCVQGWLFETGCPLRKLKLKLKLKLVIVIRCSLVCSKTFFGGRHIVWTQSLPDDDIPSRISLPEVFS